MNYSDLLGTPFVDGGREPGVGLDCYGLFMAAMGRFGVEVQDFKISCFASALISEAGRQYIADHWRPVKTPQAGDGVALAIEPAAPGMVQHFGVVVDGRRFIHTLQKTGPLLTRLDDPYWSKKIVGVYRWRD